MTVSFTYNETKSIAERIIAIQPFKCIWLQAKQIIDDEGKKIMAASGQDFEQISFSDNEGLTGYFRDKGEATMESANTDICDNEYWMTQLVRFVAFNDNETGNTHTLTKAILEKFGGFVVRNISFDFQQIQDDELSTKLILSTKSFLFMIEFEVRELLHLTDCITEIDCNVFPMKVCRPEL